MRTFLIDCVNKRMAVDNAVYPISTSSFAANIARIVYHFATGQGSIEYNDRPLVGISFTDPSPYQPQVNAWLTAAAADPMPLQLSQAVAIKQALAAGIGLSKQGATTAKVVPVQLAQNNSSGAPGWGSGGGFGPDYYQPTGGGSILEAATSSNSFVFTADTLCTGLCYFEFTATLPSAFSGTGFLTSIAGGSGGSQLGVCLSGDSLGFGFLGRSANSWGYTNGGGKTHSNAQTAYGATFTVGDIIGCAFDATNGRIWFSKNGVWQGGATAAEIAAGITTHAAFTGLPTSNMYPAAQGCISTSASALSPIDQSKFTLNFGPTFAYPPPAGYGPLTSFSVGASAMNLALAAGGETGMSITPTGGTSPVNVVPSAVVAAAASLSVSLAAITNADTAINTNLAACASIAAVIAFDVTAGWP